MPLLEKELSNKYIEVVSLGYSKKSRKYDVVLKVNNQKFYILKGCDWPYEEALFMKAMLGKALAVIVQDYASGLKE